MPDKPPGPWAKPDNPGFGVARPPAVATVQVENESVRVTRWDFEPGAATGWHRHGLDYVVVPVTDCTMLLEEANGTSRTVQTQKGVAYARIAGVEHNVINGGDKAMAFVEIELLSRPG